MALPFELFVGLRYTRASRRNRFVSVNSIISMLGMGLGVAALIVVLSVMNGFQKELRERILGVASHAQVSSLDGSFGDWQAVAQQVAAHPEVVAAAPFIAAQGLLSHSQTVRGTLVRGVIPADEDQVAEIGRHMKRGKFEALQAGRFGIVLGADLAASLDVRVGDKVVVIAPQGQVTPAGILPRIKQFEVVGIFEIGMYEYDAGLALIHLKDAEVLYRMDGQVSGLRLKLKDLYAAPRVARELSAQVSGPLYVSDWTRSHANFFRAVEIEKRVMFIILMLIVAVAAFNIIATLVMAVTEKQSDIAILRTLGASPREVMRIFVVQGAVIGVIGSLVGVVLGVLLALNIDVVVPFLERAFSIQFLSKDVYYISELPSDLHWSDVAVIAVTSMLLSLVATLYPSYRASRVNPAQALRYE